MFFLTFSFIVCSIASSTAQQHNITLDDTDPAIVYSPPSSWSLENKSRFDAGPGGAHKLTMDPVATASLTFTGIAVYFMSPLWPYPVTTQLQLDSESPVLVNLTDLGSPPPGSEETVQSAVVWSKGDLTNTTHTIRVSTGGQPFAIVDTIIYTVLEAAPPPSSPPQSTISSSSPYITTQSTTNAPITSVTSIAPQTTSTTSGSDSSSSHVLPIALGIALGVFGLLILVFAVSFCCREKKRPTSKAWTVAGASTRVVDSPPGPFSHDLQGYYTHDSPGSPYQQPYGSKHSLGGSGPELNPLMAAVGSPPVVSTQPDAYYSVNQPTEDFNPWVGLAPTSGLPNHQHNPYPSPSSLARYEPTTLSIITETSTPGMLGETKSHLVSSPTLFSPANAGYYPPQDKGNFIRLSCASDIPAGIPAAAEYQYQPQLHLSESARQSWSQGPSPIGAQSKPTKESSLLVAVNQSEETSEGSHALPPYTPH